MKQPMGGASHGCLTDGTESGYRVILLFGYVVIWSFNWPISISMTR
jgi:hypothetical protein